MQIKIAIMAGHECQGWLATGCRYDPVGTSATSMAKRNVDHCEVLSHVRGCDRGERYRNDDNRPAHLLNIPGEYCSVKH
jgi:hypothetical protein